MLGTRKKALRHRRRALKEQTLERSFVGFRGLLRSSSFGVGLPAVEPPDDVGANRPRGDLRGLGFLAFAVRLFVGGADEAALDEHVRAFLDFRRDEFCQAWPEQHYPMPFCFGAPLIIGVLPRALCSDGEHE